MKYSFMTFSMPKADAASLAAAAARFGYDGVELRVGQGRHGAELDMDDRALRQIRETFEEKKVAISCLATSISFAYDPDTAVSECRQALRVAAVLGAPCVRVFGGFLKSETDRPAARENIVRGLREAAPAADAYGVDICLELHDSWSAPCAVVSIMAEVGHPRVRINWDLMHPVLECGVSVADSFSAIRPWIGHVHVHDGYKDEQGRYVFVPVGSGPIDHRAAVRLLLKSGYKGYLSGEWIGRAEPYEEYLPAELEMLRSYERDG